MAYKNKKSTAPVVEDIEDDEEDEIEEPAPKAKKSSKKSVVVVVEDDDEDELDEEDDEEEEAPKKRGRPAGSKNTTKKTGEIKNDINWLVALVVEKTGKTYKPTEMRNFLRKMQAAGELGDREAKTRYVFDGGESDPIVKAILKRIKGGAIEKAKKESLDKLKNRKAAGKTKVKPAPVEDDDFEDDDEDDDDDE